MVCVQHMTKRLDMRILYRFLQAVLTLAANSSEISTFINIIRDFFKCNISLQKKYQECKRDLAFSIPGFQVHHISARKVMKFGKEFGKSLNKERAEDGKK